VIHIFFSNFFFLPLIFFLGPCVVACLNRGNSNASFPMLKVGWETLWRFFCKIWLIIGNSTGLILSAHLFYVALYTTCCMSHLQKTGPDKDILIPNMVALLSWVYLYLISLLFMFYLSLEVLDCLWMRVWDYSAFSIFSFSFHHTPKF